MLQSQRARLDVHLPQEEFKVQSTDDESSQESSAHQDTDSRARQHQRLSATQELNLCKYYFYQHCNTTAPNNAPSLPVVKSRVHSNDVATNDDVYDDYNDENSRQTNCVSGKSTRFRLNTVHWSSGDCTTSVSFASSSSSSTPSSSSSASKSIVSNGYVATQSGARVSTKDDGDNSKALSELDPLNRYTLLDGSNRCADAKKATTGIFSLAEALDGTADHNGNWLGERIATIIQTSDRVQSDNQSSDEDHSAKGAGRGNCYDNCITQSRRHLLLVRTGNASYDLKNDNNNNNHNIAPDCNHSAELESPDNTSAPERTLELIDRRGAGSCHAVQPVADDRQVFNSSQESADVCKTSAPNDSEQHHYKCGNQSAPLAPSRPIAARRNSFAPRRQSDFEEKLRKLLSLDNTTATSGSNSNTSHATTNIITKQLEPNSRLQVTGKPVQQPSISKHWLDWSRQQLQGSNSLGDTTTTTYEETQQEMKKSHTGKVGAGRDLQQQHQQQQSTFQQSSSYQQQGGHYQKYPEANFQQTSGTTGSKYRSNAPQDERLMMFMLASRRTTFNPAVERDARILKWLNNCRSAS